MHLAYSDAWHGGPVEANGKLNTWPTGGFVQTVARRAGCYKPEQRERELLRSIGSLPRLWQNACCIVAKE